MLLLVLKKNPSWQTCVIMVLKKNFLNVFLNIKSMGKDLQRYDIEMIVLISV